jgi:hypothetical protein
MLFPCKAQTKEYLKGKHILVGGWRIKTYNSGWWYTYPSEKYDFVSWDYILYPIYIYITCSKPPTRIYNCKTKRSPIVMLVCHWNFIRISGETSSILNSRFFFQPFMQRHVQTSSILPIMLNTPPIRYPKILTEMTRSNAKARILKSQIHRFSVSQILRLYS